jgi:hypothetical protein
MGTKAQAHRREVGGGGPPYRFQKLAFCQVSEALQRGRPGDRQPLAGPLVPTAPGPASTNCVALPATAESVGAAGGRLSGDLCVCARANVLPQVIFSSFRRKSWLHAQDGGWWVRWVMVRKALLPAAPLSTSHITRAQHPGALLVRPRSWVQLQAPDTRANGRLAHITTFP